MIDKSKELCGLYNRGSFRAWEIKFPYSFDKYLYFGSKEEAKAEAEKLYTEKNYPYSPKIRELKTL